MPKTPVRAHARKGTKGVRAHTREIQPPVNVLEAPTSRREEAELEHILGEAESEYLDAVERIQKRAKGPADELKIDEAGDRQADRLAIKLRQRFGASHFYNTPTGRRYVVAKMRAVDQDLGDHAAHRWFGD